MELEYYFKEIKKNMRAFFAEMSTKTQIPHFAMQFLAALDEHDGPSLKELSEELFVDKAHTTRAVSMLAKRGYLICRDDSVDKRVKRLYLTEKGKRIASNAKAEAEAWRKGIFNNFSESDFEQMKALAEKIYENTKLMVENLKKCGKGGIC